MTDTDRQAIRGLRVCIDDDMVPLREALTVLDDDKIDAGEYADQTIIDLRCCLSTILALLDKSEPVADGARELARRIIFFFPEDDNAINEAAALITQALREERQRCAEKMQAYLIKLGLLITPEQAAIIMGEKGE